jgi:anti-sigma regulatory factor (Ser/Thr protein kinase)
MDEQQPGSESGRAISEQEIRLPDSRTALNRLIHEFSVFAERNAVPLKVRREMQIVFDEIVSNIMRYGYQEGDVLNIVVTLRSSGDFLEAVVVDDARPFNLLELAPPPTNPHARGIGGLGVHLVRRLMDEVHYARTEGRNVVTLRRRTSGLP